MSKKCAICNRARGKRICGICENRLICTRCCGENMGHACRECSYYQSSMRYHSGREKDAGRKSFIVELNEEIEESVNQAMIAVEKKKFSKAAKILTGLIEKHPDNHLVLYGMGACSAFQEQYDEAISYFKKAVSVFPLFVEAHYNLAIAYKSIFDLANMVRALRKVAELAVPGSEIFENARDLIGVMEKSVQNDGIELDAFIKAQDEFDRAFSLMEKGDWRRAITGFEGSIRWNPCVAQPHGNMGICLAKLGKRKAAIEAFEKALEIDPEYEPAIINKYATEQLSEGQCLPVDVKSIRYIKTR